MLSVQSIRLKCAMVMDDGICTVLSALQTTFNSLQLSIASEMVGNIDNANYFIKWQTGARRLTWRSFVRPTIALCTFNGLLDMMKVIRILL